MLSRLNYTAVAAACRDSLPKAVEGGVDRSRGEDDVEQWIDGAVAEHQ